MRHGVGDPTTEGMNAPFKTPAEPPLWDLSDLYASREDARIAADLEARDARDRSRAEAPLVAAKDAVLLDTSDLGREAAIAEAIRIAARAVR